MIPFPGAFTAGVALFLIVIWDAFESIILPRRVTRRFRLARLFYRTTWKTWKLAVRLLPVRKTRDTLLSFYGPISLLFLIAVWAIGLVLSFALMQYGAGSAITLTGGERHFFTDLYFSGTTFFTLGLGDIIPRSGLAARLLLPKRASASVFLLPSSGISRSYTARFRNVR